MTLDMQDKIDIIQEHLTILQSNEDAKNNYKDWPLISALEFAIEVLKEKASVEEMFEFNIQGFAACKDPYYYDRDSPVDITVCAETVSEAMVKAEKVVGCKIHKYHRRIKIKELKDD